MTAPPSTLPPGTDDIAIDVEALNRKYAEERDKRKRSDAMDQLMPPSVR